MGVKFSFRDVQEAVNDYGLYMFYSKNVFTENKNLSVKLITYKKYLMKKYCLEQDNIMDIEYVYKKIFGDFKE